MHFMEKAKKIERVETYPCTAFELVTYIVPFWYDAEIIDEFADDFGYWTAYRLIERE